MSSINNSTIIFYSPICSISNNYNFSQVNNISLIQNVAQQKMNEATSSNRYELRSDLSIQKAAILLCDLKHHYHESNKVSKEDKNSNIRKTGYYYEQIKLSKHPEFTDEEWAYLIKNFSQVYSINGALEESCQAMTEIFNQKRKEKDPHATLLGKWTIGNVKNRYFKKIYF
jgi:hypothetical protein